MALPKMSFALRGGVITHVSEVRSGKQIDCVCPECKKTVVAKKGNVMQHHFAHDHDTACSLESVYHWLTKTLIYQNITKSINDGKTIPVQWKCELCDDQHHGDLLKKAKGVKLEAPLGPARPDVLLLDENGKPLVAIEVVVTHPPEQVVRDFYRANGIDMLTVKIGSDADVQSLMNWTGLHADSGTPCPRRKCPTCRKPLRPNPVRVVIGDCYKCRRLLKVAYLSTASRHAGPEEFVEEEIRQAKAAGCILAVRYSQTMRSRYLASVCGYCDAFVGRNYLYDYAYLPDIIVQPQPDTYCDDCKRYFP